MVAVVYTSLVALVQHDMKKLIAYSSVAHMGIVTVGLFAFNGQGLEGAMIVMLSHGLVAGALFLLRRRDLRPAAHPRDRRYGGLSINMPLTMRFFMLFTMASVGLPGTSGLRRRVPDHRRHLPGEQLGRRSGLRPASFWAPPTCSTSIAA